ncbi:hypothetical protein J6590_028383 [Homalodisca vitripennis]|nr:hypothetical protein J6590_028383 [Homalodisca vitripennis]
MKPRLDRMNQSHAAPQGQEHKPHVVYTLAKNIKTGGHQRVMFRTLVKYTCAMYERLELVGGGAGRGEGVGALVENRSACPCISR